MSIVIVVTVIGFLGSLFVLYSSQLHVTLVAHRYSF